MDCTNISYDNRETVGQQIPSSGIPYVGYMSEEVAAGMQCRPNINDIIKKMQQLHETLKEKLGDLTALDNGCLTFNPTTASQATIDAEFITEICALKTAVEDLQDPIDPATIVLAIDLLCLLDPTCEPQTTYTLPEILAKLVTAMCNLMATGTVTGRQGAITNYSNTSQAITAATRTYITGSKITVPSTKLKVGSTFKWKFNITKTAAGVASSTFDVAIGVAGTVADTAILSFTKPAGTAVVDEGVIEITAVLRNIGSAGVMAGEFTLIHNLAATGHATIPCVCVNTVSSTFITTTPNLFVGVCATTGSADAITVQMVTAEALNL